MNKDEWVPYEGSRGGSGWQSTETGEVRYQDQKPDPSTDSGTNEDDGIDDSGGTGDSNTTDPNSMTVSEVIDFVEENVSDSIIAPERGTYRSRHEALAEVSQFSRVDPDTASSAAGELLNISLDTLTDFARMESRDILSGVRSDLEDGGHVSMDVTVPMYVRDRFNAEFESEVTDRQSDAIADALDDWQLAMFTDDASPLFQYASLYTDNVTLPSGGPHRDYESDVLQNDTKADELEAVDSLAEFTQEKLRNIFGDTVTVYRGMHTAEGNPTNASPSEAPAKIKQAIENGKEIEHEHRPIESWTTKPAYASAYAAGVKQDSEEQGQGVLLKREIPVEKALAASHVPPFEERIYANLAELEGEIIVMHDETEVYRDHNVITNDEIDNEFILEETFRSIDNLHSSDLLADKDESQSTVRISASEIDPKWLHRSLSSESTSQNGPEEKVWKRYIPSTGVRAWQHSETGQIVYQKEKPNPSIKTLGVLSPSSSTTKDSVTKEWTEYEGPKGGEGWQNTQSGEVRYQEEKPSEEGGEESDSDPASAGTSQDSGNNTANEELSSRRDSEPYVEGGYRVRDVDSVDDIEVDDEVRLENENYKVESVSDPEDSPIDSGLVRIMGQDGKEYTIPPGQIGGLVLGEDRDTGKYDVDPDTFSGRLADSLVNNGMNERSGDRFINVRELQHNLSSVDTRELVLDGLRHEKDNRNSKTAVKRFKSRLRQMGMTDEEITDAITEEEEEGEVTEEVPVGDITALSEGDSVIVTPPDWDSRHDEPWETDVVSINQSDGSVMVEDPNGGSYYISGDSVTDTLSWGEGERPDDSYPVVGYDSAVEELKGERVAAGTLSSVGLNNRDSAERVIENADSDELVNFVENNVVEELIQTAETLNPSVAEELRQDTDAMYDYRDSVMSGVNNANADVRFAVSVLAVRGHDFWDMEIASGISGRTSEDETEERDDPRRLYDDLPQYTKEDIKNNLREITEQMSDVELAKTLTHLRSTTAADLSSDNNTAGVYSGKGNSISVDVDTDYSSTFTHELGHAWHHSSGIQSSAMDNRGVSDADDWNARFTPKMDSNDRTWEMSDEFEREWERYKTRYNESDSESNIQIRPYQKTNEGEFIAVTFASYIDDRSQLQEVHPEMVHLYDKYIGGGVETEEVDTIMGVSQFFEDDTPESPVLDVAVYDRVNVTAEYHEDIYNGEITSIQNASPQDSEEITYVIESGPEEHEIEASTIESMEKRL